MRFVASSLAVRGGFWCVVVMVAVISLSTGLSAQQTPATSPGIDDPLRVGRPGSAYPGAVATPGGPGEILVSGPSFPGASTTAVVGPSEADAHLTVVSEGDLTTIFVGGNSFAGNTFDLVPSVPLTLIATSINLSPAGGSHSASIYWRLGTAVGNEDSPDGWHLLSTTSGFVSAGEDLPTEFPHVPLTLLPGQTYGIYVDLASYPSASMLYTNGGPTTYSNADLALTTYHGKGNPAFTGLSFFPRQWNGIVHYNYAGPYVLDAFGGLNPAGAGHAPGIPTPYFGFNIARDFEFLREVGFYVLDGFGGVHAGDGAPSTAPSTPYFGFDIARDIELTLACYLFGGPTCNYHVLDGFGGVHAGGGAAPVSPPPPYLGFDAAKDMESIGGGIWVLDAFGGVHAADGAPGPAPATPYFGFDAARDLEIRSDTLQFYVLDKFGGVHPGGGASPMAPPTPYFGFDAAQDLELLPGGFYVLDKYGGLHPGGGAPAIVPASAYFGFDAARDLEFR